jgi:hypothetical protein
MGLRPSGCDLRNGRNYRAILVEDWRDCQALLAEARPNAPVPELRERQDERWRGQQQLVSRRIGIAGNDLDSAGSGANDVED